MFNDLIVQPIFNLLVLIYALIPGHNFGLAIIIFTIAVRLLMWPLVKKQLHQAKAMRAMQPEIKRIKQAAKGDRQQESVMLMELYKERGISPFGSIGILVLQLIILIGLYQGLSRVVIDPGAIIEHAYQALRDLPWMKELAGDIDKFDTTMFNVIDLSKPAVEGKSIVDQLGSLFSGKIYWPGMVLVIGSALAQYYQSKQLMPEDKDSRSLRRILKDAGQGKAADNSEMQAATQRTMRYILPGMIFLFTVGLASALSLYWLVSGIVAYIQQAKVLSQDEEEMEAIADKPEKKSSRPSSSSSGPSGTRITINGEIVRDTTTKRKPPQKSKPVKAKTTKRRK